MASCPSCGTQVDVDFGMATCSNSKCTLVFMVGIDGVGVMPEEQNYEPSSYETPSETESSIDTSSSDDTLFFGSDVQNEEISVEATEVAASGETEYSEDFLNSMSSTGEIETVIPPDDGIKDPLGVQRFDRSEASQLVDGPYYYDLYISGLDTSQIKDEVMRALTDKRFQWGVEDIRKKLRNGRLVFKDLNPVKAVLIVIKLQHIDVDIEWIQKLHTDPSVTGGVPGQP